MNVILIKSRLSNGLEPLTNGIKELDSKPIFASQSVRLIRPYKCSIPRFR